MSIRKEFAKAIGIGVVIFIIMQAVSFSYSKQFPSVETVKWRLLYSMLYSVVLYFANVLVFFWIYKSFKGNKISIKRLFSGFGASFLVSIAAIFLLRIIEEVVIENVSLTNFFAQKKASNYIIALVISFVVILIIHLVYFYKNYQENRIKQEKIIAGTASAQFESLKNQLDPHFLFNSLNVLHSLIEENPSTAQEFTTSLSKIYRYVLEQRDKELVAVDEELAFARTYMNLLKMRFEDSIIFIMPEKCMVPEAKIVPLSLQLLLENCIKHNVATETKPLQIKIYIEKNELIVENNYQKKETLIDRSRKGVGLQNIVNRYAILTDRKINVLHTERKFSVKLPILTKKITIMESEMYYNEETAYIKARDKVKALKGFYANLFSFCLVIPFLAFINLKTSSFQWFWFPAIGWGIGLVFQAFETFGFGKEWEEKKINEYVNKDKSQYKNYK